MQAQEFVNILHQHDITFFTGVPDSLLKPFCDYLMDEYKLDKKHHVIAHNEGGCVALAAGYHLATGKVPCVYMQNSGIGNAANPVISLTNPLVYGIPSLFIVGWRGEPEVLDEPQHAFQGEITLTMLRDMGITPVVVDSGTTEEYVRQVLSEFRELFARGKSAAFVVKKGALTGTKSRSYKNKYTITRETAIEIIAGEADSDIIVSTTGKASRELFEIRERRGTGHEQDFLTVGSMGHSSMIALGIASQQPGKRVWCLDGDGAAIMHLGAIGTIGNHRPTNLIHVVLNNASHASVGGMPTVASSMDLPTIAMASGYLAAFAATTEEELSRACKRAVLGARPALIDVRVAMGVRKDLGRPTTTPQQNKEMFMPYVGRGILESLDTELGIG